MWRRKNGKRSQSAIVIGVRVERFSPSDTRNTVYRTDKENLSPISVGVIYSLDAGDKWYFYLKIMIE